MSKYDKKIIFNYVMGNDINEYDIDDLEKDWEFMKEVFDYTNDKKMYYLCDDKLKSNFNLIKYLINKFKDDEHYILEIASNYLKNAENKLDKLEIKIMLENLFEDDDIFIDKLSNKIDMQTFYMSERIEYELALTETSDDVKEFMQLGFYWFFEQYKERELITDFIAKKMIDEIFDFRNISLEELVHSVYKYKSQVDKISSTKFIIDYISNYDYALANYISVHVGIIKDLKKSVDRIFKNFNYYNERKLEDLIDGIIYYIGDYSDYFDYKDDILLRKCVSKDLKIKDIWCQSPGEIVFNVINEDEFGEYEDELIINDEDCDEYGLYEDDIYEHEQMKNDPLYIKLLNEIKRLLDNNEIYYGYKNKEEMKKNFAKCRILKFEPKKEH